MRAVLDRELAPFDSARARLVLALRADSGTARADSIFLRFDSTTNRALLHVSPTAQRALGLIGFWPGDSLVERLHQTFLSHGIWMHIDEGEADPVASDSTARSAVGRFLTAPMRAWLDILVTEQLVPTGGDGAIGISLDELGRRIDATDRLRATVPRFAASDALNWRRKFYLGAFLFGWDNTPAFSRSDGALLPNFRTSLERFAGTHPMTESRKLVAAYLRLLRESKWRRTARVDSLVHATTLF
jgi:hypothetical protein